MASAENITRMKAIIAKQLEVDEASVNEDSSFQKDLNADSLDLVELIMSIEEEFDVTIPDKDAEKILTVRDALNYLDAHQEQ